MKSTKEMLRDLEKYNPAVREAREERIRKENKPTKAQKEMIKEAIAKEIAEMESEFGGKDYYSSTINPSKAYEMATQGY